MPSSPEIYVPHVGWLAHPAGDEVALYLSQGLYEYREQAFLWRYVRPGDAVIDCGAHFGLFSVLAAEAMGREGTIIAIEPNPESVSLLEANPETVAKMCREGELSGSFKVRNHWRMYESDFQRAVTRMIEAMTKQIQRRRNGRGSKVLRLPNARSA